MSLLRSCAVAVFLLLLNACANDRLVEPSAAGQGSPQTADQYWCETHPEECNSGDPDPPADPAPEADGYWLGTTVTPSACFHSTGVGISDLDFDGMSDYCENLLADNFRPLLNASPYDCDMGMEPYYAVKHFPANSSDPTGGPGTRVRIFYALSYYQDCGDPNGTLLKCNFTQLLGQTATFNGLVLDFVTKDVCDGHIGDSEFIVEEVVYDATTEHWVLSSVYTSAHWHTPNDRSRTTSWRGVQYPDVRRGYPMIYAALYKHANYPSVATCEGGLIPDDCQGNAELIRVRAGAPYNLGSYQQNFIEPGGCVKGGLLVQYYEDLYRKECFWTSSRFAGWDLYGPGVTPYRTELLIKFECDVWAGAAGGVPCNTWGVNRKGTPIA